MSAQGLGCAKTKTDFALMPSGRRIFAIFSSERNHKPRYCGCGHTAWSFHTARVSRRHQTMSTAAAAFLKSGRRVRAAVAPPTTFNRSCYWWRNLIKLRTLVPVPLASATGHTRGIPTDPDAPPALPPIMGGQACAAITDLLNLRTGPGMEYRVIAAWQYRRSPRREDRQLAARRHDCGRWLGVAILHPARSMFACHPGCTAITRASECASSIVRARRQS
jgi:hypothetical protein